MFIRELLPQDLNVELDRLSVPDAMRAASSLAGVVGKAHARQMDVAMRRSWSNESIGVDPNRWMRQAGSGQRGCARRSP